MRVGNKPVDILNRKLRVNASNCLKVLELRTVNGMFCAENAK